MNQKRHIILGTDWWTDCDDTAALRMVCRYAKSDVWQFLGIVLNGAAPYAAASVTAVLNAEGFGDIPVGIDTEADDFGGRPPYQYPVALAGGTLDIRNEELENGTALYRRLLASAPDHSVELLEIGYLQVLASLLASGADDISPLDGISLVKKKVRCVWCMGGNWKNDGFGRENNFCRNSRARIAAASVLSSCPVPMHFLGYEIGEDVFAHPPQNPEDLIRIAFDAHGSSAGRCAWDPLLVHLASADDFASAGYTAVLGYAAVDAETGENRFTPDPRGPHSYVVRQKPTEWYEGQIDRMLL